LLINLFGQYHRHDSAAAPRNRESKMKKYWLASTVLVAGTSTAFAGGMEVSRFNPGFMFQGGNYAELSVR